MQLFSLRKFTVPLRNGKLSAECSETPLPYLSLILSDRFSLHFMLWWKSQEQFTPSLVSAMQLKQKMLYTP